jgi:hypothetical protein
MSLVSKLSDRRNSKNNHSYLIYRREYDFSSDTRLTLKCRFMTETTSLLFKDQQVQSKPFKIQKKKEKSLFY